MIDVSCLNLKNSYSAEKQARKKIRCLPENWETALFKSMPWVSVDGTGSVRVLHFQGTEFVGAVASRENACAYRVELLDGHVVETKLPTRFFSEP